MAPVSQGLAGYELVHGVPRLHRAETPARTRPASAIETRIAAAPHRARAGARHRHPLEWDEPAANPDDRDAVVFVRRIDSSTATFAVGEGHDRRLEHGVSLTNDISPTQSPNQNVAMPLPNQAGSSTVRLRVAYETEFGHALEDTFAVTLWQAQGRLESHCSERKRVGDTDAPYLAIPARLQ